MTRITVVCLFILTLAGAGCNTLAGAPDLSINTKDPLVLTPGEVKVITVKVQDRYGIVDRVIAQVTTGETDKHVTLLDDGITEETGPRADEVAGDGVWSTRVNVPLSFIEGETKVVFTALRSNGLPVEVRQEGQVVPLEAPLTIQVKLPGE